MRQTIELELPDEDVELLQAMSTALGHEELEQTFQVMLHLLSGAISLTSHEHPTVRLYTRDPQKPAFPRVICPGCQTEVPVYNEQGDGFRECAVRLF